MIENVEQRILAAKQKAAGLSGEFPMTVESGTEREVKRARPDGRVDVSVPSLAAPTEQDMRGRIADDHVMPESFTEPTPGRSVQVGSLLVFHYESGAPFAEAREVAVVEDADGKRLRDRAGLWRLFQELKTMATAKKGAK